MLREQGQDCQVASEQLRGWVKLEAGQPASQAAVEFDYMSWKGVWVSLHALVRFDLVLTRKIQLFLFTGFCCVVLCCCVVFLPNMLPPRPFGFPCSVYKAACCCVSNLQTSLFSFLLSFPLGSYCDLQLGMFFF